MQQSLDFSGGPGRGKHGVVPIIGKSRQYFVLSRYGLFGRLACIGLLFPYRKTEHNPFQVDGSTSNYKQSIPLQVAHLPSPKQVLPVSARSAGFNTCLCHKLLKMLPRIGLKDLLPIEFETKTGKKYMPANHAHTVAGEARITLNSVSPEKCRPGLVFENKPPANEVSEARKIVLSGE